jgi:hypothetical protein
MFPPTTIETMGSLVCGTMQSAQGSSYSVTARISADQQALGALYRMLRRDWLSCLEFQSLYGYSVTLFGFPSCTFGCTLYIRGSYLALTHAYLCTCVEFDSWGVAFDGSCVVRSWRTKEHCAVISALLCFPCFPASSSNKSHEITDLLRCVLIGCMYKYICTYCSIIHITSIISCMPPHCWPFSGNDRVRSIGVTSMLVANLEDVIVVNLGTPSFPFSLPPLTHTLALSSSSTIDIDALL